MTLVKYIVSYIVIIAMYNSKTISWLSIANSPKITLTATQNYNIATKMNNTTKVLYNVPLPPHSL